MPDKNQPSPPDDAFDSLKRSLKEEGERKTKEGSGLRSFLKFRRAQESEQEQEKQGAPGEPQSPRPAGREGPQAQLPPHLASQGEAAGKIYPFHDERTYRKSQTLIKQLRSGEFDPETVSLFFNDILSDQEVREICRDLNIDWDRIPGSGRNDKVKALADYFQHWDAYHQEGNIPAFVRPQLGYQQSDLDMVAIRRQTLSEMETQPEESSKKKKKKARGKPPSRLERVTIVVLALVLLLFAGEIWLTFFRPDVVERLLATPIPPPTPTAVGIPAPRHLLLPGGLEMSLEEGELEDGAWQPAGAEWLTGTEVCRWVGAPSSAALDAVVKTLKPGQTIGIALNNAETLTYRILEIKSLSSEAVLQQIEETMTQPCLSVVIFSASSGAQHQVIVAIP